MNCEQSEICQCPPKTECIFNCVGNARCANTEFSTQYNGQTIIINCIGISACFGATGDLSPAASVTWKCQGTDACKDAYLESCGFNCELNCNCDSDCINEKSCGGDYFALINPEKSFTCNGIFCITPDPTISPTLKPSDSPIADGEPTRAPTIGSSEPTISPSPSPTISGTEIPTLEPTPFPIEEPSKYPIINEVGDEEDEEATSDTVQVEFLAGEWIKTNMALFILIIVGIVMLCCIPVVICIYCVKVRSAQNINKEPENIVVHMTSVSTDNDNFNVNTNTNTNPTHSSGKSYLAGEGPYSQHISPEPVSPVSGNYGYHANVNFNPLPQMPVPQPPNNVQKWNNNTPNYPQRFGDSFSEESFYGASTPINNMHISSPLSSGASGGNKQVQIMHGHNHGIGPGAAGNGRQRKRRETYTEWNYEQICDWILSLHNGLFVKYERILRISLRECNLKGRSLKMVNNEDIQSWGIKDFEHMKLLQYYMHELINSNINSGNLTVEGNAEINVDPQSNFM